MRYRISRVDHDQLNREEKRAIFELLLTSFSGKFVTLSLTSKEKLDVLLYLEQKYTVQDKSAVDYIVKDGDKTIGVLSISGQTSAEYSKKYPVQLSKRYGFCAIFKYVLLLSALEYKVCDKEEYIENIAVHEQYQKQGIAKALIMAAQAKVKKGNKLSLIVSTKNQRAIRLYLNCGFSIIKERRNFILKYLANEPSWFLMEWSRKYEKI